jgi:hypothetical protein
MQGIAKPLGRLTDKMKIFLIMTALIGPIPARTRGDRLAIGGRLGCSQRTVRRVLAGVRGSGCVHVDESKKYSLIGEQAGPTGLPETCPVIGCRMPTPQFTPCVTCPELIDGKCTG